MIDSHAALIYTMVLVSAADRGMTDAELHIIGDIVNHLPVFAGYEHKKVPRDLKDCATLLSSDDGLAATLRAIKDALPVKLHETAYAVACDVAAADGTASQEALRVLELLRDTLEIDQLIAAGIERGARARFTRA